MRGRGGLSPSVSEGDGSVGVSGVPRAYDTQRALYNLLRRKALCFLHQRYVPLRHVYADTELIDDRRPSARRNLASDPPDQLASP